jgi:hypothetical protein
MRATIEKYLPDLKDIPSIKAKLKTCKDEWLETKPGRGNSGNNKYLGVNTVRQILDHAVEGVTYWDFGVTHQWREEVYKFEKNQNAWVFDGYVYHVRGYLFIPGLGHREQYGCKVAVGGKDNQDSAYKAATANCLVKCSSLFGVGEEIYSKIKIEMDDDQQYQQMQNDPNYYVGNQPPQNWNQQGGYQQNWNQQQPQQTWGQHGNQMPQQWQQNWNQQQNLTPEQQWYQQQEQQISINNYNWTPGAPNSNNTQLHEDQYPFNPHEPGTPEAAAWDARNMANQQPQAQEQQFTAQPQGQAQPQGYQAQGVQYGAPVQQPKQAEQPQVQQPSAIPAQWDPNEMQRIHAHRARLKLDKEEMLAPYIRDYLKNEQATLRDITPENLKGFNDYLDKFSA